MNKVSWLLRAYVINVIILMILGIKSDVLLYTGLTAITGFTAIEIFYRGSKNEQK